QTATNARSAQREIARPAHIRVTGGRKRGPHVSHQRRTSGTGGRGSMRFITSMRAAAVVVLGLGCAACSTGSTGYGNAPQADARAPGTAAQQQAAPVRRFEPAPSYDSGPGGNAGGGMGGSY